MEEEEFRKLQKEGRVEEIKEGEPKEIKISVRRENDLKLGTFETFETFLELLRQIKRHRTTVPTHKPQSFIEQIEFYDDGTNFRVYFYIKNTWRYVALT